MLLYEECKFNDLESLSYAYTVEVDITIPQHLHDYLSDLPVEAEHLSPPGSDVKRLCFQNYFDT